MTDLLALATRVEAEPPSRELADECLLACGYRLDTDGEHKDIWIAPSRHKYAVFYRLGDPRSNPLTSLDAALELVPDGWDYALAKGHNSDGILVTVASLGNPENEDQEPIDMNCNNLSQALTAACLRARAAVEEKT